MEIKKEVKKEAYCLKFIAEENDIPVGRAFLYILYNDLHEEPFGFLEDVFVDDAYRGGGIGQGLVEAAKKEAQAQGCYKLIFTARNVKPKTQEWYIKLGFTDWGKEFRIDFK